MRIWSILLIQFDLKWYIHLSRSLFLYTTLWNILSFLRGLSQKFVDNRHLTFCNEN